MVVYAVVRDLREVGTRCDRGRGRLAAKIGWNRQHAEYTHGKEAVPLRDVVVGDHAGDVKAQHEYETDERKHAHEHVKVMRGIWNQMHMTLPLPGITARYLVSGR
jgi:hypothetical protein